MQTTSGERSVFDEASSDSSAGGKPKNIRKFGSAQPKSSAQNGASVPLTEDVTGGLCNFKIVLWRRKIGLIGSEKKKSKSQLIKVFF